MWGRRVEQCRSFGMCLNLNDYHLKISRYSYRSTCMNPMVTTNQKAYRYTTATVKGTQAYH